MTTRSLRKDESGFTLIEILVSALLVGVMAVGVLSAIDGAQHTSGRDKSRSIAASLAQQDQERLRSMTITNLAAVSSTPRTQNVCANGSSGCTKYYVASQSSWVADTSSSSTCTLSSARSYNLQVTSTVTWDGQGNAPSIVQKSLVAAPPGTSGGAQGSLAVRLREVDGVTPLSGVTVNLTGPAGLTRNGVTDANGCVVWDYLPAGSGYTISYTDNRYWDPSGSHSVTRAVSVTGARLATQNFTFSAGDEADFTFKASSNNTMYTTQADQVTITRGGSPADRITGTTGTLASKIKVKDITPYASPSSTWSAYAGSCANAKPSSSPGLVSLGNLYGGTLKNYVLQLPGIKDIFSNSGSKNFSGNTTPVAHFTTKTVGCPQTKYNIPATPVTGILSFPGVPYGTYDLCLDAYITSKAKYYHQVKTGVVLTSYSGAGTDITGTWDISSADLVGACP